jgi:Toprim domain
MTVQPIHAWSYGLAALERECAKVASTVAGRNEQLSSSSFSLGQLVGAGVLDRNAVEQHLFAAAEVSGYVGKDGAAAARATIKSGLDRGERSPRNIQSRQGSSPSMQRVPLQAVRAETALENDAERIARARYLWARRRLLDERYLRGSRGLRGPFPVTLGSLPAHGERGPAMIAAFGVTSEPEPGVLAIADDDVKAVHLTKLTADAMQKSGEVPNKIMIGSPKGSPIVLAPPNDLLAMCITEGIEDALSAHEATGLGAWAAGSASLMPALADAVPGYIDCVSVLAHRDPAGIKGANELATRLRARGTGCDVLFLGMETAA